MKRLVAVLLVAATAAIPGAAGPDARFLGAIALDRAGLEGLGGLSAIQMAEDGAAAWLLSDRGRLFPVTITREGGRIAAVGIGAPVLLTDADGDRPRRMSAMDSEGIARLPEGGLVISFEGDMRVARHGEDGREVWRIDPPPGADALPGNGGYEALAADAEGRLLTLAEDAPGDGPVPLFRREGRRWQEIGRIPRTGGFRPVGLDVDDRGRVYLLERGFSLLGGFTARLTRFEMPEGRLGAGTVILQTPPGRHGNLEGLSLWRMADGALVVSLIADDNFSPLLPSEIVEYRLPD